MLHTDGQQFARLEVAAATGRLPPDLGKWVLSRLAREFAANELRTERDDLVRQAARLIEGTIASKVKQIRKEADRLNRRALINVRRDFPGLVAQAMQRNGGKLPGERQLRRIIAE